MTAQSIEYIELYTSDIAATTGYLVSAFGFAETARVQGRFQQAVHLCQGDVRLRVSTGPATEGFLGLHGDGIADIAFGCDDVAATREAAVAAGAELVDEGPGTAVVSGFGDVRHTLVPVGEGRRHAGRLDWTRAPIAGRILKLDHVAVCVEAGTLADSTRFYADGFGLERYSSEYIEIGAQAMDSTVVRSPSGGVTFTTLEPDATKESGQIDAFLAANRGPGVQHLAFLVDDIVPAVGEFHGRGVDFLTTPGAYYDLLDARLGGLHDEMEGLRAANVLADRDEWGYLLQLFARSPYPRGTLFYELIQRRGGRGFGSANIKALYEALHEATEPEMAIG